MTCVDRSAAKWEAAVVTAWGSQRWVGQPWITGIRPTNAVLGIRRKKGQALQATAEKLRPEVGGGTLADEDNEQKRNNTNRGAHSKKLETGQFLLREAAGKHFRETLPLEN